MRILHMNCATMRPFGFFLSDTATLFSRAHLVVHCLLIETDDGLVLVETGYGTGDIIRPTRLVRAFTVLSSAARDLEETAAYQVVRLGYAVADVRHIVLTHLHLDHAGGLPDFAHAQVHVYAPEHKAAMQPRTYSERYYIAAHWAHGPQWVCHELKGEQWFGFDCVRILQESSPAILLVPLTGHTRGHCGVAIQTKEGWLLHCGDAYISRSQIMPEAARRSQPGWTKPLMRRLFPHIPRLRELVRCYGDQVRLFCAHDPFELAEFQDDA